MVRLSKWNHLRVSLERAAQIGLHRPQERRKGLFLSRKPHKGVQDSVDSPCFHSVRSNTHAIFTWILYAGVMFLLDLLEFTFGLDSAGKLQRKCRNNVQFRAPEILELYEAIMTPFAALGVRMEVMRRPESTCTEDTSVVRHRSLQCAAVSVLSILWSITVPLPAEKLMDGKTVFQAQGLSYEVIDGLAIHGGDIILGTSEEAASAMPRLQATNPDSEPWSRPQAVASEKLGTLWPNGIIPYVIDDSVSAAAVPIILSAIEEWNTKTVITLVERTMQKNYVRFVLDRSRYLCRSGLGMMGGEQWIFLTDLCSKDRSVLIHEIGHTVGLLHEHQRKDRDRHVMLLEKGLEYLWIWPFSKVELQALNHGPYDYASIMHYPFPPSRVPHDTIPPGMPVSENSDPSATLSVGDIDGVARLYGEPPTETTIATNPPGLDIIVDGERVTTPASFDWEPGSKHRIEAPSPQKGPEGLRFVFGRWTDEGSRNHIVTADPDETWYQASFILQRRVTTQVKPDGAGRVTIRPESPDGFYTLGTQLEVSAEANPGSRFNFNYLYTILREELSQYSNPSLFTVNVRHLDSPHGTIGAVFDTKSCFLLDSNVEIPIFVGFADHPAGIGIEGSGYFDLPWRICDFSPIFIQADRENGPWNPASPYTFYRFSSWSDGGAMGHRITPTAGGKLTLNLTTHHAIRVESLLGASRRAPDQIDVSPPPEKPNRIAPPGVHRNPPNAFYGEDTRVQLQAKPEEGFQFLGWGGSVSGTKPVKRLVMDGYQYVKAYFARDSEFPGVQPGILERFSATGRPAVSGRMVYVPPGATELAIDVEMERPGEGVILGIGPDPHRIAFDSTGRVETSWADALSTVQAGSARIRITSESTPWFSGGKPYFIAIAAERGRIEGTLLVTLEGGPPVQAYPRAFTFVTTDEIDPAPQRFRLTNVGDEGLLFRIDSNRHWLKSVPEQGFLDEGESAEITVTVNSFGIRPETHTGKLTVVRQDTITDRPESSAGVGIPVTFAVIQTKMPGLHFAHFVNGDSLSSDVVLVNVDQNEIRPVIYFHDQTGELLAADSVLDVGEELEIQEDGGLSVRTGIEPLGEQTISTHGRGEAVIGSVRVVSDGRISGVLRFEIPSIGVAGVGAGEPVSDAVFPARRLKGGINTGAAIRNLSNEPMTVTCSLMQGGEVMDDTGFIMLARNGQDARFINELFPATDTSDFVGSVRCTAPDYGVFTGLALEMDAPKKIITTLPVVPVDSATADDGESVLNFAHFANGDFDGVKTISHLVFVNVATSAVAPAIYFYDQMGKLIDAESLVDVRMDGLKVDDGILTVIDEIPPLGEMTISTNGMGAGVSGSVRVVSNGPIGGVLRFEFPNIGVAAVGAGEAVHSAIFPARRRAGGINTGAAVRNLSSEPATMTCDLMQGGEVMDNTGIIPLAGNGHQARFINELFPATDTSDFVGSVRCTVSAGGKFTGVALEMDADQRIFTTLPVVPILR